MPTLMLRLAAPLQSWGSSSKFEIRTTEKMPTKSGVVGMLAAALGYGRDNDLSTLNALKFGVRADREGEDITDFHMAHEEDFWKKHEGKYAHLTTRHYLSDAVFLVGLEGDADLLIKLENALRAPRFPLFLGRRSCPPTLPIVIGIRDLPLKAALYEELPLCEKHERLLRVQIEPDNNDVDNMDAGVVQDMPISFNPKRRIYGYRKIKESFVEFNQVETEHDAMMELG